MRPRVAILCSRLQVPGGAERLAFEEAARLRELGYETKIVALLYDRSATFGTYAALVDVLSWYSRTRRFGRVAAFLATMLQLWKWIAQWRPDLVIAMSATDSAFLRLPTAITRTPYLTHINGTFFWIPGDRTRYARLHRPALVRVLAVSPTHGPLIAPRLQGAGPAERLRIEVAALVHWWGVRGARERLTFSRRMAWEVEQIYGQSARALKGAFPRALLDRRPERNPLAPYREDGGAVILNVNRLDQRKRVELAILGFAQLAREQTAIRLVIGGTGPAEAELRRISASSGAGDRIHFVGFIPEAALPDWLSHCDVFVHPNWAEFAIAPFEAMALGTKVVWANEMELDPDLVETGLVFAAEPTPEGFARELARALATPGPVSDPRPVLERYSWENYFAELDTLVRRHLRSPRAIPDDL